MTAEIDSLPFDEGDTVNVYIDDPRPEVADGWKLATIASIRRPEWDGGEDDILATGPLDRGGSFILTEKRDGLADSIKPVSD